MIYEIRTYDLRTRMVEEYRNRFAERLPGRLELSMLGGHWATEIGPLNQVVAIWPYDDIGQRSRIRREAEESGKWPPDTDDLIVNMKSEIYLPAPFMTPLREREIGPVYEMRLYTWPPEVIPEVLETWGNRIGLREEMSPLAGCWYSEMGGLNNFVHLWAYPNMEQRDRIREEAKEKGVWPPGVPTPPTSQENKILLPSSFSPMQ